MTKLLAIALFLAFSVNTYGADLYLRNNSGHTIRVKYGQKYTELKIKERAKLPLDNIFKTEVKVIYQSKAVASTTIKPSSKDSKMEVRYEKGTWVIKLDRN